MTTKKKQDRRIGRTRKLLQNALIELLKQKPLAKIQIKEIAEVANVSRPAFYNHFETKEQLLFSLVDDLFEQIEARMFSMSSEMSGEGNVAEMHTMLTKFYQEWQHHSEEIRWVMQVENKDLLIAALRTNVYAIKQKFDQYFPPLDSSQAYESYLVDFATGGVYMLMKRWIENDFHEPPETMAGLSIMLLQNGFSPMQTENLLAEIKL